MRAVRFGFTLATLAVIGLGGSPDNFSSAQENDQTAGVKYSVAKYADLKAEVLKHRGKVVVVDCWSVY